MKDHLSSSATLDEIYGDRFSDSDAHAKDAIWKEITKFLQRYIPADASVLDIACDRGDFIRNIVAGEKWATDIRDMSNTLTEDVRFVRGNGLELDHILPVGYFDVAFMSNYLEHLGSNDNVLRQLKVTSRVLKPGGRVIILQPNIRLVGARYWDFIDHSVALTERSLVEAAVLSGFVTETLIVRFLPYTTKSRLPRSRALVRAYLRTPVLWRVFGKQSLYVGRNRGPGTSG
jgi:ubiquinone/menaquinone biosynthesis C-methylase UbiE